MGEKRRLAGIALGRHELARVQRRRRCLIQTQAPAGDLETSPEQIGERALTLMAGTESRVVVSTSAQGVHSSHDVRRSQWDVILQPLPEQRLNFLR